MFVKRNIRSECLYLKVFFLEIFFSIKKMVINCQQTQKCNNCCFKNSKEKKKGKDEDSIQSSTTPDQSIVRMESDKSTRKHHILESHEDSLFIQVTTRLRETGMTV